ncbi:hypothetical protein RIF29_20560 [Crotalaria pallida]|uniref:Uncharacterized protein n=1 Tax=Crotalaria pallida TaxID=3830 RepID=A0AAN9I8S9_CROPI
MPKNYASRSKEASNNNAAPISNGPKQGSNNKKILQVSTAIETFEAHASPPPAVATRKQREKAILEKLSKIQNAQWNQYVHNKAISEEVLSQHVVQRTDEELAQIHHLLGMGNWDPGSSNKPPDKEKEMKEQDLLMLERESPLQQVNGSSSH